jgi:hypothetical protein
MKLDPCVKHTQVKPSRSLAGFHAAEIMAELPSLIFVMHQVLYR